MHITLLTIGSRGDVQPFIALGRSLQQKGAQVRLATHARFEPLARKHGLSFAPIHSDPMEILNTEVGQAWIHSGQNPISLIQNMIRLGRPVFKQLIQDASEACRETDLIVYTVFGSVAYHLAEKQGIPSILANLQPLFGRRSDFPAPGAPTWPSAIPVTGKWYNRFTYRLVEQVFWQPFRPLVQNWRRDELQLNKAPFWGPYQELRQNKRPFLFAYSRHAVPSPQTNWPDWYHTTGYWQLPPSQEWKPDESLVRFLEADAQPPLYFGFGSMADATPKELLGLIQNALRKTNERAILLSGWAGLGAADLPDNIHLVSSVPHSWLFERVRATVHHGGAGTTGSALTAGKPTLVIPYFADQHFWGDQVYRLGAGPKAIPRQKLTTEKLVYAIEELTQNGSIQASAQEIGSRLQQEQGADTAADIILSNGR